MGAALTGLIVIVVCTRLLASVTDSYCDSLRWCCAAAKCLASPRLTLNHSDGGKAAYAGRVARGLRGRGGTGPHPGAEEGPRQRVPGERASVRVCACVCLILCYVGVGVGAGV